MLTRMPSLTTAGLLGAALILAGCSTTPADRAGAAASSMRETQAEIDKVSTCLDAALAALDDIATNPKADLKPQYEIYSKAVDDLDAQAALVGKRAQDMRSKGDAYFAGWEKDTMDVSNPEIKEQAEARRAKLKDEYAKVTTAFEETKAALDPLLTSLKDVKSILKLDLTDAGLEMAADEVRTAKKAAVTVEAKIAAASAELGVLADILSPGGAATK